MSKPIRPAPLDDDGSVQEHIERIEGFFFAAPARAAQGRKLKIRFEHGSGLEHLARHVGQALEPGAHQVVERRRHRAWLGPT